MSSLRCAQCGLINFATATHCKRCRTPFVQNVSAEDGADVQGIVLADGYVLPPPPSVGLPGEGLWRDGSTLIVSKGAQFPDRCIRCNAPAYGPKLKKKLNWHHPAWYLLVFVGLLVYFVVAMFVRQSATLELALCDEHRAAHRRNLFVTWGIVLLAVLSLIIAMMTESVAPVLVGILLIPTGVLYGAVALKIVTATRIDKDFVWMKGINKDYLANLPHWPGPWPTRSWFA